MRRSPAPNHARGANGGQEHRRKVREQSEARACCPCIMSADPKELVPTFPSSVAVPGLDSPIRWKVFGAFFGASATAPVVMFALLEAPVEVKVVGLSAWLVAASLGGLIGRSWYRLIARERERRSVGSLLMRLGRDGAIWGGSTAAVASLTTIALLGFDLHPAPVLLTGLAGASAGAVVTTILGLPHILDLSRGRVPWKSVGLALVLGPAVFLPVLYWVVQMAIFFGL